LGLRNAGSSVTFTAPSTSIIADPEWPRLILLPWIYHYALMPEDNESPPLRRSLTMGLMHEERPEMVGYVSSSSGATQQRW